MPSCSPSLIGSDSDHSTHVGTTMRRQSSGVTRDHVVCGSSSAISAARNHYPGAIFAFTSPRIWLTKSAPVAKVLPPITIAGIAYRVLRLDGTRGPRYLLRSTSGDLIGLFPRGAEPMRLYATPLAPASGVANPFAKLDFFDINGRLSVAEGQKSGR
jgi:hypothetical protein